MECTVLCAEALRVVWSGGVAAAVALSCGPAGAELALQLIDGHSRLWEAAAAILEAALGSQAHLIDSIQAVDTWAADTGKLHSSHLTLPLTAVLSLSTVIMQSFNMLC